MALIQWSERFATGIREIDEQHQRLFQAVNDLQQGLLAGQAQGSIQKTLGFLLDYTQQHFRDEEQYMRLQGFPGLAAHQTEHQLLLEEVAHLMERFQARPDSVRPMEVARFLGDWLTHHIHHMDFQYASYAREKG